MKTSKFYTASSVTVFDQTGSGRYAKTSPTTYKNVIVEIEGNKATIYLLGMNAHYITEINKRTTSMYWALEGREIKKETFTRKLNALKREAKANKAASDARFEEIRKETAALIARYIEEAKAAAADNKDRILPLLEELSNSVDQAAWHDKANQIVGIVGYRFVKLIGFKETLQIAKDLAN